MSSEEQKDYIERVEVERNVSLSYGSGDQLDEVA